MSSYKVLLTGPSLYSMNGSFVAQFYLDYSLNVFFDAFSVYVQDGDNPRPKKKKKIMKKKTKRKGKDFEIPRDQINLWTSIIKNLSLFK